MQSFKDARYVDSLSKLYSNEKETIRHYVNSQKYDEIIECLFQYPVVNADIMEEQLSVSRGQAVRYLNILEKNHILRGDNRKRGRYFYFEALLDLTDSL